MADCWVQSASPIRHPPSPVWNLYLQSATAIIDKRCIAGKIVNIHCVPDEQRWRIAGFSPHRRYAIRHHRFGISMYNRQQRSLIADVSLAKLSQIARDIEQTDTSDFRDGVKVLFQPARLGPGAFDLFP